MSKDNLDKNNIEVVDSEEINIDLSPTTIEEDLDITIPLSTSTALVEQIEEDFGGANIGVLEERFRATEKQSAIEKEVRKRIEENKQQESTRNEKLEQEERAFNLEQKKKNVKAKRRKKIRKCISSLCILVVLVYLINVNPTVNKGFLSVVDFGKALFNGQDLSETELVQTLDKIFNKTKTQHITVTIDDNGNIVNTELE